MVPRNIILEECGDDESDSSILWHTASSSSGLPRGVLTCTRYCACTHDGYKVVNTIFLVVVLSYELNVYFFLGNDY